MIATMFRTDDSTRRIEWLNEAGGDEGADSKLNGVDGVIAGGIVGDGEDALRFAGGDLEIGGVDAGVKIVGLALKAVLIGYWGR